MLTTIIISVNNGLLSFISCWDQVGLHHVIRRPRNTGMTRDTRDMNNSRYGSEKFFSELRTNLPKSQTQKVVVAKLATVLQNVIVTDRSRSPPHRAENINITYLRDQ